MKRTDVPKLKAAFGHWLQAMQSDAEPRRQVTGRALQKLGVLASIVDSRFHPDHTAALETAFANWLNALGSGSERSQRQPHDSLYRLGVLVALADAVEHLTSRPTAMARA